MSRILVVDDEADLCEILQFNLESEAYEVTTANSAEEALSLMEGGLRPDLLLLDVMMERMSGFEMARQLRERGNETPIIFLTALNKEPEELQGFESGADDYITKPFSFQTVLARVKAVLKRASMPEVADVVTVEGLSINPTQNSVTVEGVPVTFTKKELQILLLLVQHRGCCFSREQILNKVWESDTYVGDRSVDVHIARIRKKLGPMGDHIGNKTGFGYFFK
ncbi:MAG: response regulator transcription factor [Bacteroidales bacterium]|nr:response regulator transcription factor [Bacteroidales bacterium]